MASVENEAVVKQNRFSMDRMIDVAMNNKSILLLVLMVVVAQLFSGGIFFKASNISTIFRQCAVPCIITMGYIYNLTAGSIDLSVGHIISMCCVIYNEIVLRSVGGNERITETGTGIFIIALLATLAIGMLCGMLNAVLINKFNLIPFILTMGTGQIYRSIAMVICGGVTHSVRIKSMQYIGQGILMGWLPVSVLIFAILTVIAAVIIYRTKLGRHIVAVGGNREAARVSGVNIVKTKVIATTIMGFHMALAAIVLTGRVTVAQPAGGTGMEMDAIAGVVIGGTALGGGKPNVIGAIFGALILSVISNTLNLLSIDAYLQWAVKGAIIIVAIMLDLVSENLNAKRMLRVQ